VRHAGSGLGILSHKSPKNQPSSQPKRNKPGSKASRALLRKRTSVGFDKYGVLKFLGPANTHSDRQRKIEDTHRAAMRSIPDRTARLHTDMVAEAAQRLKEHGLA